ncbi:hypothetical protein [Micromonospora sp. WMMC250]|uniref:hypothetical protein n=1 Tax=Micromonospora sp. WMMC250 TaxID=3014781 RepID=UPI0022B74AB4|nr:hypothetical protein [Micromonospora sp. WMMC250]MCZ7379144.1 hypothetical protein [Micromonospora sp. WMMC250]
MQDTVAVALITSLSTLAAAGLTGLVGALSTRRQLAHQLTVARQESAERRTTRRDELRRVPERLRPGVPAVGPAVARSRRE